MSIQIPNAWEVLLRQQVNILQACSDTDDFTLLQSSTRLAAIHPLYPSVRYILNGKTGTPPTSDFSHSRLPIDTTLQCHANAALASHERYVRAMHAAFEQGTQNGDAKTGEWQARLREHGEVVVRKFNEEVQGLVERGIMDIKGLPEEQREDAADRVLYVLGLLLKAFFVGVEWIKAAELAVGEWVRQAVEAVGGAFRNVVNAVEHAGLQVESFFGSLG